MGLRQRAEGSNSEKGSDIRASLFYSRDPLDPQVPGERMALKGLKGRRGYLVRRGPQDQLGRR